VTTDEKWAVVRDALVEAELAKRMERGGVIRDESRIAVYIAGDIDAQAQRRPAWRQQQVDKHFGNTARPSSKPWCPWCELVFALDDEQAVRGDDGMLYCRVECARRAPFVSFADAARQHPEWAESLAFVALVLERKGLGGGTVGLSSIAPPGLEPAGADLPF
jgi:hypothetical protein